MLLMNFEKMTNSAVSAEIGRRVERYRLDNNITQDDLADTIGVTRKTYAKLESGQCKLETLIAALRALGQIGQLESLVSTNGFSCLEMLGVDSRPRQRARRPQSMKSLPN